MRMPFSRFAVPVKCNPTKFIDLYKLRHGVAPTFDGDQRSYRDTTLYLQRCVTASSVNSLHPDFWVAVAVNAFTGEACHWARTMTQIAE